MIRSWPQRNSAHGTCAKNSTQGAQSRVVLTAKMVIAALVGAPSARAKRTRPAIEARPRAQLQDDDKAPDASGAIRERMERLELSCMRELQVSDVNLGTTALESKRRRSWEQRPLLVDQPTRIRGPRTPPRRLRGRPATQGPRRWRSGS